MSTRPDKKSTIKSTIISIESLEEGFCSDCMFFWCKVRSEIVYCSMKYKGTRGFVCENSICDT